MLRAMFGLVAAAALWAAWNGAVFTLHPDSAYRAESAWLIFAAVLILSRVLQRPSHSAPEISPAPRGMLVLIPIAASIVLYSPILSIGLLSDDFVLVPRALHVEWLHSSWVYVRPLPLAAWWAIDRIVPGALSFGAIHLFGVILHGVNAWLVFVVARRLGLPAFASAVAASLFLAWPFNVEAIAWLSAVFDACMTACVLAAVVIVRSDAEPSRLRVATVAILTAAAVASKESGITLPLLLALVAVFGPRSHWQRAMPYVIAAAAVVAIYLGLRFTLAPPPRDVYPNIVVIKNKMLTRPFGALAMGIHRDILRQAPWIGIAVAIGWAVLFARAARRWNALVFRIVMLSVCWVLISVLPLWTMFFVTDTLENSRYLYMASAMWAIAVSALIANGSAMGRAASAAAIALVAGCAMLAVAHQHWWRDAAAERDRVIAAWATVPADCDPKRATGLPDSVAGAYVFRNGFPEAVQKISATYSESCIAAWKDGTFSVTR